MMKIFGFTIDKEMVKTVAKGAGTVGKAVIIEGVKGVLLKSVANTITTSFDGGIEGVKKMTLDDIVGRKKKKLIELPKTKVEVEAEVIVAASDENVEKRDLH